MKRALIVFAVTVTSAVSSAVLWCLAQRQGRTGSVGRKIQSGLKSVSRTRQPQV